MVQAERSAETDPGEPLFTEQMSLSDRSGSVGVIIPSYAVKILGFEPGEERQVEVHDRGVWIPKEEPDE